MEPMTDTAAAPQAPAERLAAFHRRREESVLSPKGFLALTNTQWVVSPGGERVWNAPGTWFPLPAGEEGLRLEASAEEGITVDGALVDGAVTVTKTSEIVLAPGVLGTVIGNEDATEYAVRVWDSGADDRERFGSISLYDYNPDWVIQATFTPVEGLSVGFEHTRDHGNEREEEIPGLIKFEKDGVAYELAAFRSGRALQLVFADATSGDETYSVGRFLFVAPNPDGTITLDFNNALLPPCAFSYSFNCPMPPKQNRFAVPIRAGEKQVLAKDGALLHA
jgi:uncharacterized protein (DUF1684 family)